MAREPINEQFWLRFIFMGLLAGAAAAMPWAMGHTIPEGYRRAGRIQPDFMWLYFSGPASIIWLIAAIRLVARFGRRDLWHFVWAPAGLFWPGAALYAWLWIARYGI